MNNRLAEKLKTCNLSSKQWWSVLKSFISSKSNSAVPPLETDGLIYADDLEKANILNGFFRDQTLLDDGSAELPEFDLYPVNENHSFLTMTSEEVKITLETLPVGKATGPDGISNRMLKESLKEICFPVAAFFNHSFSSGEVPDAFKESHVCPVPKGGETASVSSN